MNYELTYIIPSKIQEKEQQVTKDKVAKIITTNDGEILDETELEKKRLNYPISGSRYGNYIVLTLNLRPDLIKKINNSLKEIDHILKYLIIKKERGKDTPVSKYRERKKEKEIPIIKTEPSPDKPKTQAKKKVELKDLDKKLEEMLKEE